MDIEHRINKVLLEAKRRDFDFNTLLMSKNYWDEFNLMSNNAVEEIKENDLDIVKSSTNMYTLRVLVVEDADHLSAANILDIEEDDERRFEELLKTIGKLQ